MTRKRWWRALVVAYAVSILALSLLPISPKVGIGHLDKLAHLGQYLIFAWILTYAIRIGNKTPEREHLLWVWIYASSYGLLVELLQLFVPWRSGDWIDAVMNGIGAAVGVWIGRRFPNPLSAKQ